MVLALPSPTTEPRSADGTPVRHWPAGLTEPMDHCCRACGYPLWPERALVRGGECWTCWTWGAELVNGFRWMGPREGHA